MVAATSRKLQAEETRARVRAAAIKLFGQHGYHATSINQIVAAAGVAKGTFFVHFPSKDAVVQDLVKVQTGAARKARSRALESVGAAGAPGSGSAGLLAALRAVPTTLAKLAAVDRTLSRAVIAALTESQELGGAASALFEELLAEMTVDARAAIEAGLLADDVKPAALAHSLLAAYLGGVLHFATSKSPPALEPLVSMLVEASLAGALPREGRRAGDRGAPRERRKPRAQPNAKAKPKAKGARR